LSAQGRLTTRRPVMEASDEVAFDDPKLDEFAASLANNTSALILVGEEAITAIPAERS